jgi:hypothetical protein
VFCATSAKFPKRRSRLKRAPNAAVQAATSPPRREETPKSGSTAADAKRTARMLEMRGNGDSWGKIAKALKVTPGKAQFLMMLHRVAEGGVPRISTEGSDKQVAQRIAKARARADEFSSWGWLAARTGRSEAYIKGLLAEHELYTPKAENIAAKRAAAKNGSGERAA